MGACSSACSCGSSGDKKGKKVTMCIIGLDSSGKTTIANNYKGVADAYDNTHNAHNIRVLNPNSSFGMPFAGQ